MAYKRTDEGTRDEHAIIGGVAGKKVFIIDDAGNIVTFNPTVASFAPYAIKMTVSGTDTYVGIASPGTAQATAAWKCFRIDESSGTVITWADGNSNYDNVATDLTSLSYS